MNEKQKKLFPDKERTIMANIDTLEHWFSKNGFPLSDKFRNSLAEELYGYQLFMFKRGRLFEQLNERVC